MVVGKSPYSQVQAQNEAPRPARSRADETLEMWNAIGNKLIAMALDFPEDKYDFTGSVASPFAMNTTTASITPSSSWGLR